MPGTLTFIYQLIEFSFPTDEVMAADRQGARGKGAQGFLGSIVASVVQDDEVGFSRLKIGRGYPLGSNIGRGIGGPGCCRWGTASQHHEQAEGQQQGEGLGDDIFSEKGHVLFGECLG